MAKWSGKIGYIKPIEIEKGLYDELATERMHYGDTISNRNKIQPSADSPNSNLTLSTSISIIADSFAVENLGYMKYVVVKGVKWGIVSVNDERPRFILTTGGIYNG